MNAQNNVENRNNFPINVISINTELNVSKIKLSLDSFKASGVTEHPLSSKICKNLISVSRAVRRYKQS